MTQFTHRQQNILDFLAQKARVTNQEILAELQNKGENISRETLVRELNALVKESVVEKTGKGRGVTYQKRGAHSLLEALDVDAYLARDVDARAPKPIPFNFEIFSKFEGIFTLHEIAGLRAENEEYKKRAEKLSSTLLQKELERITIELSWKSSKIEGNTYTLLDTETLLKEHREAAGHTKEEAVMILNHKKALDYILKSKEKFRTLTLRAMEDVHRLLVDGLNVNFGVRSRAVGITGAAYRPLDNKHQIAEATEKAAETINTQRGPWSKSLAALLLIAYIQPFEDGNKRASRLLANACLLAHSACPLSFRSIDETEYKKALTIFYELNNAALMKTLFVEQWRFAAQNYFL